VAEFSTFPVVEIVASLVSTIAAVGLMSALTMTSGAIAVGITMFVEPSKLCTVPVTSPDTLSVLAVASLVADEALPVTVPVTFPVRFAEITPAEKFPDVSLWTIEVATLAEPYWTGVVKAPPITATTPVPEGAGPGTPWDPVSPLTP
jgi:hypothetical protein